MLSGFGAIPGLSLPVSVHRRERRQRKRDQHRAILQDPVHALHRGRDRLSDRRQARIPGRQYLDAGSAAVAKDRRDVGAVRIYFSGTHQRDGCDALPEQLSRQETSHPLRDRDGHQRDGPIRQESCCGKPRAGRRARRILRVPAGGRVRAALSYHVLAGGHRCKQRSAGDRRVRDLYRRRAAKIIAAPASRRTALGGGCRAGDGYQDRGTKRSSDARRRSISAWRLRIDVAVLVARAELQRAGQRAQNSAASAPEGQSLLALPGGLRSQQNRSAVPDIAARPGLSLLRKPPVGLVPRLRIEGNEDRSLPQSDRAWLPRKRPPALRRTDA